MDLAAGVVVARQVLLLDQLLQLQRPVLQLQRLTVTPPLTVLAIHKI
jgi:hypothetical protein